jgi:hypothetical protein
LANFYDRLLSEFRKLRLKLTIEHNLGQGNIGRSEGCKD